VLSRQILFDFDSSVDTLHGNEDLAGDIVNERCVLAIKNDDVDRVARRSRVIDDKSSFHLVPEGKMIPEQGEPGVFRGSPTSAGVFEGGAGRFEIANKPSLKPIEDFLHASGHRGFSLKMDAGGFFADGG